MVSPLATLSLAIHSNPGAYSVLVGSGVSVGAGIPTGWGVVLDLIAKLARLEGLDAGEDPAGWYRARYGEEPDYSRLLDALAKLPAERSMLLRSYFEPTPEERRRGVKVPGAAHAALAELAAGGYIRVFLTTNFDRMLERALEDAGVVPTVISTPDALRGAPPLAQARCTVVKLHGDYLDSRIKNTPEELATYDPAIDALLDRVIEEHGLIVCGWSASWDVALRRALERAPAPRYTTYWADVVPPGEHAARLIEGRGAQFLQVASADAFFGDLAAQVSRLDAAEPTRGVTAQTASGLPTQLTSFVGRERELEELRSLLGRERMITLTGTGGAGKTRLAIELATDQAASYPDGVWFVDLAPIVDEQFVPAETAAAVGVAPDALRDYLRGRSALIVLDNCEHLVTACARMARELLEAAPAVTFIATSREPLGTPGEVMYRVPSLSLPEPGLRTAGSLAASEAARLFVERAVAAEPGFELGEANADAVAQIVEQLDGLPLAIELAAARVRALSAAQIAERLGDAFRLLTSGTRTALPRQQTLEAAIDWSYDLLSEPERRLLARLSVFRGGFSLEAAEAIGALPGVETIDALQVLLQLVDRSLVVAEHQVSLVRYRLLEPIRQYGAARLSEGAEEPAVRRGHAEYFAALLREAEPQLRGADQVEWLSIVDRDYDNVRAGLGWAIEARDAPLALAMCSDLHWFWHVHRDVAEGEGSAWTERAFALDGEVPAADRARALLASGFTAIFDRGDFETAWEQMTKSLRLYEAAGIESGIATAHVYMVFASVLSHDFEAAEEHLAEARRLLVANADPWSENSCFMFEGIMFSSSDHEHAASLLDRGLTMARERGDVHHIAWFLLFLGNLARDGGQLAEAAALYAESRRNFELYGEPACVAAALAGEGTVTWLQGDREGGIELHLDSLQQLRQCGESAGFTYLLGYRLMSGTGEPAPELMARLQERLGRRADEGARQGLAEGVELLATAARRRGDRDRAIALERDLEALQ